MIYVLDACTFINLANSGQFLTVLHLPGCIFFLSKCVKRESKTILNALNAAIAAGRLNEVDDSSLSAFEFQSMKNTLGLGEGETECILAAKTHNYSLACDDSTARKKAEKILGKVRVTGSIGLLKQCVSAGTLTPELAFAAYEKMKASGGFLPALSLADFQ